MSAHEKTDPQTTIPTSEMVEAGAKAAYGEVMINPENWPDVSGSVGADVYRRAACACFIAMMKVRNV